MVIQHVWSVWRAPVELPQTDDGAALWVWANRRVAVEETAKSTWLKETGVQKLSFFLEENS